MVLAQQENNKRPFFSIVISCYNSRKTIGRVLESLTKQELDYDDLEVIISDDCSTEPYDDIVQNYEDKLNIKHVSTEYNCCPGNTRQAGLNAATGVWVSFSDHDDEFCENGLSILKNKINTIFKNERFYIITSFYKQNDFENIKDLVPVQADHSGGWTHGKFYNLDNFIKKFNLHFKKDLLSNEDIYFTTNVNCYIEYLHSKRLDAGTYCNNLFTYVWYSHPQSLSHSLYDDEKITFFEKTFLDYAEATGNVYLNSFKKGLLTWAKGRKCAMDTILLYYFYSAYYLFDNPNNYLKTNFDFIKAYLKEIKETFNLSNKDIWAYATEEDCLRYKEARDYGEIATGPFIPPLTLNQWLEWLSSDEDNFDKQVSQYYKL